MNKNDSGERSGLGGLLGTLVACTVLGCLSYVVIVGYELSSPVPRIASVSSSQHLA